MSERQRSHSAIVMWYVIAAGIWAFPDAIASAQIRADVYVSGLTLPLEFVQDPSNPSIQYVVEQGGRIRTIRNGGLQSDDFLDLSAVVSPGGGEQGLLGLAFPDDYGASGRFYVNFTNRPNGDTVVARFRRLSLDPPTADPASRFDLQWSPGQRVIAQPFANHNGGHLAFGPDGFLYIGMGDGGSGDDPGNRAQNPRSLLGKMLRIDVSVPDSDTNGYRVPASNPFAASTQVLHEIWAIGLRNPWKFSFDSPAAGGTGALIIGDVGQNDWEEVDYEPAAHGGRNYGWRSREGAHDHVTTLPPFSLPLTDPILEYSHTVGHSITGGFVYRGLLLPRTFVGRYFYADFVDQRVWSAQLSVNPVTGAATVVSTTEHTAELGGAAVLGNISSMGLDSRGELFLVSYSGGRVFRVTSPNPAGAGSIPVPGDYDGDHRADAATFQPSTATWNLLFAGSGSRAAVQWGAPTDRPVPGDYDGDGLTDLAVYRPSTGEWFILYRTIGTSDHFFFGGFGDIPVAGDYDGDGRADLAVWRPSTGTWFVQFSQGGSASYPWGASTDVPVARDYDGDGRTDVAVYRPSTGQWFVLFPSRNLTVVFGWGAAVTDQPVPVDYQGDHASEIAVWRPSTAQWFILDASGQTTAGYVWGAPTDVPVPADYDGDGKADLAVFRPTTGEWFVFLLSSNTSVTYQ
jgi:glucose/arabinose dehydrogenase